MKGILQIILPVVLLMLLFTAAMIDLKREEIPLLLVLAGSATGLALKVAEHAGWKELVLGCLPGTALLILSFVTKQAVGTGDGAIILAAGIFLGWEGSVILFLLSLLFAAIASVIFLTARKRKRKERLPFLPFVLGGYVVLLLLR